MYNKLGATKKHFKYSGIWRFIGKEGITFTQIQLSGKMEDSYCRSKVQIGMKGSSSIATKECFATVLYLSGSFLWYVQKVCEPACQQLPIRPSLRVHTFCDWCFFLMVIILNVHTVLRFISQMCCIYKKNCGKWHFIFHDQEIQYTLQYISGLHRL